MFKKAGDFSKYPEIFYIMIIQLACRSEEIDGFISFHAAIVWTQTLNVTASFRNFTLCRYRVNVVLLNFVLNKYWSWFPSQLSHLFQQCWCNNCIHVGDSFLYTYSDKCIMLNVHHFIFPGWRFLLSRRNLLLEGLSACIFRCKAAGQHF